jgi:hypothetical protein
MRRTEDAIHAGTLAMMDITGLRLRSMNTVATKLAKKLNHGPTSAGGKTPNSDGHSRNQKVNQSVPEDEGDKSRASHRRSSTSGTREGDELPSGKQEDDEVKAHGVDKRGRKNGGVRARDHTSRPWNPSRAQHNTLKRFISLFPPRRTGAYDAPCRRSDQ